MSPLEQYERNGYVVFRDFFIDQEVSLIDSLVDPIYQHWRTKNAAVIFQHKLVNMHSLTRPEYFLQDDERRVELFEAIASQKLVEALEQMFGNDLYFHNTQLFFNPSNPERLPYWHRDMQFSPIEDALQNEQQDKMLSLHVRIPLLDEKGLELIPGTHKRWDTEEERKVRLELDGRKNHESLDGAELIDLRVGDVLIFNAQMIHRGNYQLNSERKALDICIGRFHPLPTAFLDPEVLPSQQQVEKITHKDWYLLAQSLIDKL